MVSTLSTIALILSLGGQFLLSKKTKIVFPIWILSNVCWIAVNLMSEPNVQQIIMYVVYTAMNCYSWYSWRKDEKSTTLNKDDVSIISDNATNNDEKKAI